MASRWTAQLSSMHVTSEGVSKRLGAPCPGILGRACVIITKDNHRLI